MKGIILAGGTGSRLFPLTTVTSKQLLPVYDKPMIYYPLSTLMLAGINDILVITTPSDRSSFERLLGDGSSFGVRLSYAAQELPKGLADAFLIGRDFLEGEPCVLILGDNIFYGGGLVEKLKEARTCAESGRAALFGYYVPDPERFGVVEFDGNGKVISLEEKPLRPKTNYAATGLYFYDERACNFAKTLEPSSRGELEITDLNRLYMEMGDLHVQILGRGFAWFDTGTCDSLSEAGEFVRVVEQRQGVVLSSPEEIAFRSGWIDERMFEESIEHYGKSLYGEHLENVAKGRLFS